MSTMTEPAKTDNQSTPIRRFAVQPIETSSKSHRASKPHVEDGETKGSSPRRKFVPQLEEASERSHGRGGRKASLREGTPEDSGVTQQSSMTSLGARKFAPQLVETAKRSRKRGDTTPAMQHTDKTDLSPGDKIHLPRHIRLAQSGSLEKLAEGASVQRSPDQVTQAPESRFSYSNLSKKTPRQASFRVPQLEPIASPDDSEESGESNVQSMSTSPSAISDENEMQKQARRLRQSCDEKFSGYLLAMAARAAEKQLQEQALAAFPNERFHQAVNHFAFKRESENSDDEDAVMTGSFDVTDALQRRMSTTGWDLIEMQKHKEKLEEQRRKQKLADSVPAKKEESTKDPWKNPFEIKAFQDEAGQKHLGGAVQDPGELTKMRSAASPPMLGRDIEFPNVQSPKQTMIDATQKPRSRRKASGEPESRQHSGLWTTGDSSSPTITRKNSTSVPSPGLWGGCCNAPENKNFLCVPQSPPLQTGLLTPQVENGDPFSPSTHVLPTSPCLVASSGPTPCTTPPDLANIDSILTIETTLETEYPDSFITQLYNYLSLGYPALARKYDTELSKISRIPIEEIRKSDQFADAKGYVGAPEGDGWEEKEVREKCGRWSALRLYVMEWARQQPKMRILGDSRAEWGGAGGRRGSWGI